MTRTKLHAPLLPMAACLMAGIAVGDYMTFWPTALLVLLPCLVVTAFLYRWPRLQTLGIACCVLLTGAILGSRCRQQLHKSWDERPTVTEVVIVSEPVIKEKVVVADWLPCLRDSRRDQKWPTPPGLQVRYIRRGMSVVPRRQPPKKLKALSENCVASSMNIQSNS